MHDEIDVHLGARLRRRRKLLQLTQLQVAQAVGLRFQQIQKYECAANRMSAACLYKLAKVLEVPVSYFYEGLSKQVVGFEGIETHVLASKETKDLVSAFQHMDEEPRRRLLELATAMKNHEPLAA